VSTFRELHQSGCFVIPNPWDVGSARYLKHLGFKALATTSAGMAFSHGLPDNAVPLETALAHIAEIVSATDLPVNADFENGFAHDPEGVARNVSLCLATGVAGLSIEDSTGDPQKPLYDLAHAVERIQAARAAIDASGSGALLTARAECFLTGHPDPLNEAIRRLQAFSAAGADVLYAPGPRSLDHIAAIVKCVSPKPVNILAGPCGYTVHDLARLGARRISVGAALARAAWGGFMRAAKAIAESGSFAPLADAATGAELNALFRP
jgi:2-methylisocitrate lyase-like PEP mutase family enzyme